MANNVTLYARVARTALSALLLESFPAVATLRSGQMRGQMDPVTLSCA